MVIPTLLLTPMCVIALWQIPKIWRLEADIPVPEVTEKWWPFGEAVREGFLRALPVGILSGTALTACMALKILEEATQGTTTSRVASGAAWVAFLAFVALLLTDLSVTLFNQPRFIVPPACREEPGAVALWWRSRRYRRRPRA
jgi:predicted lysophospholipase L1 biosynthesis ABC-type transport system permease subunit